MRVCMRVGIVWNILASFTIIYVFVSKAKQTSYLIEAENCKFSKFKTNLQL